MDNGRREPQRMRYSLESRLGIVRSIEGGMSPAGAAGAHGASRATGYRLWRRYQAEGWHGLADRRSTPRRQSRRLSGEVEAQIVALRLELRAGPEVLARIVERPASTVGKVLRRAACSRLPGGPEGPEKLRERRARYAHLAGGDRMFKIVDIANGASVGSVGFWTKKWRDEQVYEIGWMVAVEFQGRGIALAATAQAIELARRDNQHRSMHAFPSVDNAPSNAICRKLGFDLLDACEFESPKGHPMTCNDWRLDLRLQTSQATA
jgi:RimJ/RimL family protein N-acetyltransferase